MSVDLDPRASKLWAQVRKAEARHGHDPEGDVLRSSRHPSAKGKVILGDVTEGLISVFGPHEAPILIEPPGFDEQRWALMIRDSELELIIRSRPYWGFGLFSRCYLNEIEMNGPVSRRARIAHDLTAILGRYPHEAVRERRFTKVTGIDTREHKARWTSHVEWTRQELSEQIEDAARILADMSTAQDERGEDDDDPEMRQHSLDLAGQELEIAREALHDGNSLAVERALARVELALIQADPESGLSMRIFESEEEVLESEVVDGMLLKDPEVIIEVEAQQGTSMTLMPEEEEIPFIDMSQGEEE